MMERPGTSAGSEIAGRISASTVDAGAIACAIRQIAGAQSLRQHLGGTGNVEGRPVERINSRFVRRILDVVEDDRVGLQTIGRIGRSIPSSPVEFERRRLVFASTGMFHGNF